MRSPFRSIAFVVFAFTWLCARADAQTTFRASATSAGAQANSSSQHPSISANGWVVAFTSLATDLVGGDTNGFADVFVHDLRTGVTERISVANDGTQANGESGAIGGVSVSEDGERVAFQSSATNLVPFDSNGRTDIFVWERATHTLTRASVSAAGIESDGTCESPALSADGRWVAFYAIATTLAAPVWGGGDVYVKDLLTGGVLVASVDSSGVPANSVSGYPAISSDGRFVAFATTATNLDPRDADADFDVYVHDFVTGATELVSVDGTGNKGDAQSGGGELAIAISGDGRFVAFDSQATNLVPGDVNGSDDVFVHDRATGETRCASVALAGAPAGGCLIPTISRDGRHVAFMGWASDLVAGDTNGVFDVFVRDFSSATTTRASVTAGGGQANGESLWPSMSASGRYVSFSSNASNLVPNDTSMPDAYVRDRGAVGPTGVDECQPGVAGVLACPCGNPPLGSPAGCDNSRGTGGAVLHATGVASVLTDSVVLQSSGERPSALSLLVQGDATDPAGQILGQGVSCVGGQLHRLFARNAAGGAVQFPSAGDPSITARASALGAPIAPGSSRWYAVIYRDPIVLGGCAPASTLNLTQTMRVVWGP